MDPDGDAGPALTIGEAPFATRDDILELSGTCTPGGEVTAHISNGPPVPVSMQGGTWSVQLALNPGSNLVGVTAVDESGWSIVQTTVRRVGFLNIAHRGASSQAPENTLAAFRLALEQGADDIEFDVHYSSDGRAMVIHDHTTGRTAAGAVDLPVHQTDSARLRELDVGSFKGAAYAGERIPFLEEVLALLPPGRRAWVELKDGPELAPIVAQVIRASGRASQVIMTCFDLPTLLAFRKVAPSIPLWLITRSAPTPAQLDEYSRQGIAGLGVHAGVLTEALVADTYARRLGVVTWTVDDANEMTAMRNRLVEGVMTDRPDLMRTVAGMASAPLVH